MFWLYGDIDMFFFVRYEKISYGYFLPHFIQISNFACKFCLKSLKILNFEKTPKLPFLLWRKQLKKNEKKKSFSIIGSWTNLLKEVVDLFM